MDNYFCCFLQAIMYIHTEKVQTALKMLHRIKVYFA